MSVRHEKRASTGQFAPADPQFAQERAKKPSPRRTLGVGGQEVFGGYIQEHEEDHRLNGTERYRLFSNILANTSIVAASVRYFLGLLTSSKWSFEAAQETGNDGEAERLADLTDEILSGMTTPWHRVVRRAAMFRFYGHSIQEWTAEIREDGAFGFRDIEPRPQKTIEQWDVDESGTLLGVVQISPQSGRSIYLPRAKVVYVVDDTLDDSPVGLGLFRHIVESSERLKRIEQLEVWGHEGDLRGVPVGRAPLAELQQQVRDGDLTEEERIRAVQPMRAFLSNYIKTPNTSLLLDSATYQTTDEAQRPSNALHWDVDLMQNSGTGLDAAARTIDRISREIARVFGTENLFAGDKGGSLAMSKDKSDQFALLVDGTLLELRETFRCEIVERLFELNGWDKKLMPQVRTESVRKRSFEEISSAVRDIAEAGAPIMPGDAAVEELFEMAGLSPPKVAKDLVESGDLTPSLESPEVNDNEGDDGGDPSAEDLDPEKQGESGEDE